MGPSTPCHPGPLFVKPNTLGAKLGIDDASRAADLDAAFAQTRRIWQRYRDRALIQSYLAGSDVRVSFMDLGHKPPPLGIHRVTTSAPTGYPTLDDSLRMTRLDASGTSDGLEVTLECLAGAAAATEIEQAARHLAKVLALRHYWSMDFRLDPAGRPGCSSSRSARPSRSTISASICARRMGLSWPRRSPRRPGRFCKTDGA